MLSFIPVLTPIAAPIALATGAAALGIDAALVASGNGDWKALAVDAALMAVPGVGRIPSRAIAGQRAAGAAARGADAAVDTGRAMPQTTRVYRVEGPGNARLSIDDAGDVAIKGDQMLFLNFGQRARADKFLARRLEQGYEGTQIKRFDVDSAYVDELRATSVLESQKRLDPNAPLRVDVNQAPDQFGLRAHHFDELRRRIRTGTGVVE